MVGGFDIVSATIRGPAGCSAAREGPAEVAEVVDTKFAGSRLFLRRAEWEKCGCEDPPSTTEDTDPTFAPLRICGAGDGWSSQKKVAEALAGTKA